MILYHFLSISMDNCFENKIFKSKITEWIQIFAKFLNGTFYDNVIQIVNLFNETKAEFSSSSINAMPTLLPNSLLKKESTFSKFPRSGTFQSLRILAKVFNKNDDENTPQTFWNKYFSSQSTFAVTKHSSNLTPDSEKLTLNFNLNDYTTPTSPIKTVTNFINTNSVISTLTISEVLQQRPQQLSKSEKVIGDQIQDFEIQDTIPSKSMSNEIEKSTQIHQTLKQTHKQSPPQPQQPQPQQKLS